jgi:murein DD-endopeptidase MepM/ murein hydrolase activator NlpD
MLSLSAACASGPLSQLVRPPSPHEQYVEALREAGLDASALGRDWLTAAMASLESPSEAELPFNEAVFFVPDTPRAAAYRFALTRGRQLAVTATLEGEPAGQLFVDLFRVHEGRPERIASLAPDVGTLSHEVDEDGVFIIRVQPELLRGGRASVVTRTLASLPFPVPSLARRPVESGFGDERDAGRRQHEGIDIFAARGTPVVAVRGGLAQPGTNPLGGTVVWVRDAARGRSYYYAHLESTAITSTQVVKAGTVLGYIGNTGNARNTAPHLHFGIYGDGALDPLPFVAADQDVPTSPSITLTLGGLARVRTRIELRAGADRQAARLATLEADTLLMAFGAVASWLRVELPDGVTGYVGRQGLVAADTPLRRTRSPGGGLLRQRPYDTAAPVASVTAGQQVEVLGRFSDYEFVRLSLGATGWLRRAGSGLEPARQGAPPKRLPR